MLGLFSSLGGGFDARAADPPAALALDEYRKLRLTPTSPPSNKVSRNPGLLILKTEDNILSSSGQYGIDLLSCAELRNRGIRIENVGPVEIVNPWVVVNGKRDWFDTATILKEVLGSETDPEKRAFRIWRFLRDNRYHWHPAEPGLEPHDPVKFINVYGYGLCDDSAASAEALFTRAGFNGAQSWVLEGHVVAEVYYNDDYHMFDPDLQVFYPEWESDEVASVDDCMQDGSLVERVSGPAIRDIYTSIEDNVLFRRNWLTSHTMAMTLRPGESLERFWFDWGLYHSLAPQEKPPLLGNGILTWPVPLGDPEAARRGGAEMTNLEFVTGGAAGPRVRPADPAAPGVMVVGMRSPYVFVGGVVQLGLDLAGVGDGVSVEFSRDRVNWQPAGSIAGPAAGAREIGLGQALAPVGAPACYRFWVRVTLRAGKPGGAGLGRLAVLGTIQCSPLALPGLEPAMLNQVAVRFAGEPGARLRVSHVYEEMEGEPADPPVMLNRPWIKVGGAPPAFFSWNPAVPDAEGFEALISRDKEGLLPVAPPLWQWCGTASQWTPDTQFLAPDGQYWWSVRYRDALGTWRRWSGPQAFSYQTNDAAAAWRGYE